MELFKKIYIKFLLLILFLADIKFTIEIHIHNIISDKPKNINLRNLQTSTSLDSVALDIEFSDLFTSDIESFGSINIDIELSDLTEDLGSSNSIITDKEFYTEDISNSEILISDTENTINNLNSTSTIINSQNGGLSTGGIIAIIIPSILFLIGFILTAILCSSRIKPPISPMINVFLFH